MAQPDMIGIVVKDMAAALRFYRLLGLHIPGGAESEGHVEVIANGYRIAWDSQATIQSFDPDWKPPQGKTRGMSMAFKCSSPAEVDALYHEVVKTGYSGRKEPWDAFWGQRYAQVADPDGNVIDLFAPLEK